MIKIRRENVPHAGHPSQKKQINPIYTIETTGEVKKRDINVMMDGNPVEVEKKELVNTREISEHEHNFYSFSFELLIDNSKSDVTIQVDVANDAQEKDMDIYTISKSLFG